MNLVDLIYIIKWWGLLLVIGLSFLPLATRLFSKFFDKGYLFSKIFGILLISYTIFISSSLHLLKFSTPNIVLLWVLLTGTVWFFFRKETAEIKKLFKIFLVEEFIFLITLIIWSIVRSYQPAIHDLEKFMDFGFLNSFLRSNYFPPRDMWLTPLSINYYYFGHLFTAVLTKLSNIPSFITFNLMMATLFAFTFSVSFSLGANLINQVKKLSIKKTFLIGLFTAFLVTFAGNLQTIYSFFKGYNGESPVPFWNLSLSLPAFPNSYWYPNATRFIYHTIHEFPSYSFVVADLHGHVLDIPIVIALLAIFSHILISKKIGKLDIIFLPLLLSVSYMTNAWDGLIYLGLAGIFVFALMLFKKTGNNLDKNFISAGFNFLKYFLPISILFFIFSFVFNRSFSPFASGIGFNCSPDFLINMGKIGPFIFEKDQCLHSPLWQLGILYGFFLFIFFSFLIFLRKKTVLVSDYIVLILSFFSLILITIPEFFYLKDIYTGYFRANTMFKLSYQAFIMLSFSSAYILIRVVSDLKLFKDKLAKFAVSVFIIVSGVLIFLVSIYPYFSIPSGYGNFNKSQGLDGTAYLKEIKPGDYDSINWLNKNILGQPVILEAQGDSYTDYARISANTGLPTVLGWTVHEWLWRGSYDIPSARFGDIKTLYETSDIRLAKGIIEKYNIKLIYVGVLEEEKYKPNEQKFLKLGQLIYSNSGARIYKIL